MSEQAEVGTGDVADAGEVLGHPLTTVTCAHCKAEQQARVPTEVPEGIRTVHFECSSCGKVTILATADDAAGAAAPPDGVVAVTARDGIGTSDTIFT
jgi:predicted RNA-binding Zn-ribbon protein involved in translation (DUF1610 family)